MIETQCVFPFTVQLLQLKANYPSAWGHLVPFISGAATLSVFRETGLSCRPQDLSEVWMYFLSICPRQRSRKGPRQFVLMSLLNMSLRRGSCPWLSCRDVEHSRLPSCAHLHRSSLMPAEPGSAPQSPGKMTQRGKESWISHV